ncbi:hypothetical protein [Paenibacillus marinisediminis]
MKSYRPTKELSHESQLTEINSPEDPHDDPAAKCILSIEDLIKACIDQNKLIRLLINKGRGTKLSLPGRIVGYDSETQVINVYHVDEKQVYSFSINEVEDLIPFS